MKDEKLTVPVLDMAARISGPNCSSCMRSLRRPGVATTTSNLPRLKEPICARRFSPPTRSRTSISLCHVKHLIASLAIWVASSRVGEMISAPMVFFDSSPERNRRWRLVSSPKQSRKSELASRQTFLSTRDVAKLFDRCLLSLLFQEMQTPFDGRNQESLSIRH